MWKKLRRHVEWIVVRTKDVCRDEESLIFLRLFSSSLLIILLPRVIKKIWFLYLCKAHLSRNIFKKLPLHRTISFEKYDDRRNWNTLLLFCCSHTPCGTNTKVYRNFINVIIDYFSFFYHKHYCVINTRKWQKKYIRLNDSCFVHRRWFYDCVKAKVWNNR